MAKVKSVKSKTTGMKTKNMEPAEDFTKGPDPEAAPVVENSIAPIERPSGSIVDNILKSPHYRTRPISEVEGLGVLSTEKRTTKLRDKIGVAADHLADELMFAVSTRSKKDKEYIKGLVWSLGVLFDKLNTGSADTLSVHLPTKLLENVKLAISVQIEKKSPIVVDVAKPDYVDRLGDTVRSTNDHAEHEYVVSSNDEPSSATALPSTT